MSKVLFFDMMYEIAKKYYEHYGDLEVSFKFKTLDGIHYDEEGLYLGIWVYNQRSLYRKNKISNERKQKLLEIGMRFETNKRELMFEKIYELAKNYYEHYGNLEVLYSFKTSDGIHYDEEGYCLGNWINDMRARYKKGTLSDEKIQKLSKIGMRFETNKCDIRFDKMYKLAKKYYEYYGNLDISEQFKTKDGVTYDKEGVALGSWVVSQRQKNKIGKLSQSRIELLENIGMDLAIKKYDFGGVKHYELAKKYYEHYGNLEVAFKFKTKDGITYDKDGLFLGSWLKNKRDAYNRGDLSQEMIDKLSKIGMRFEKNISEINWNKVYLLLKKYYDKYGNIDFDSKFRTLDGVTYNSDGHRLSSWVYHQIELYNNGKLSEDKVSKLEALGVSFIRMDRKEIDEMKWMKMYNLACKYYEYHNNLMIVRSYRTVNGYNYDKCGLGLGVWISAQRSKYNRGELSQEKVNMLDLIGMVWNVRYNNDDIKGLCNVYNIDYKLNIDLLEHMLYKEFYVKLKYLEDNGLEITNNGKLHEIFSISDINMQMVYGISLERLFIKYNNLDILQKVRDKSAK